MNACDLRGCLRTVDQAAKQAQEIVDQHGATMERMRQIAEQVRPHMEQLQQAGECAAKYRARLRPVANGSALKYVEPVDPQLLKALLEEQRELTDTVGKQASLIQAQGEVMETMAALLNGILGEQRSTARWTILFGSTSAVLILATLVVSLVTVLSIRCE